MGGFFLVRPVRAVRSQSTIEGGSVMCKLTDDIKALGDPSEKIPVVIQSRGHVSLVEGRIGTLATMVEDRLVPTNTIRFLGDAPNVLRMLPRWQIIILVPRPETQLFLPGP